MLGWSERRGIPWLLDKVGYGGIPARYASVRFPGKPLARIAGRPMIQHVVERVRQAGQVSRVVVATDDPRIKSAVEAFGGEAILTRADHQWDGPRCRGRSARCGQIYVNVQGDEPLIDPGTMDAAGVRDAGRRVGATGDSVRGDQRAQATSWIRTS